MLCRTLASCSQQGQQELVPSRKCKAEYSCGLGATVLAQPHQSLRHNIKMVFSDHKNTCCRAIHNRKIFLVWGEFTWNPALSEYRLFPIIAAPHYLSYMDGGAVTVIQPDCVEHLCSGFSIVHHALPQVRAVAGLLAIAKLDTVTPSHQFSSQVHVGAWVKNR